MDSPPPGFVTRITVEKYPATATGDLGFPVARGGPTSCSFLPTSSQERTGPVDTWCTAP